MGRKPPQRNQREDNFLSMLNIPRWEEKDLIEKLSSNSQTVLTWLSNQEGEWHRELYALLGEYLQSRPTERYYSNSYPETKSKLSQLQIVLCRDGSFRRGVDCYFPGDDAENGQDFPRVTNATYASGSNKRQQEKARKFLEDIGVREVGEAEQIEAILRQRYIKETIEQREQNSRAGYGKIY